MTKPINITSTKSQVDLYYGMFGVYVLGGWDIDVNDFSIILKHTKSNKVIIAENTHWRIQSHELGQKAKKIMSLDVTQSGIYDIEFKNQDSLKVWDSNFQYIFRFFKKSIKKEYIQILIK
ncbi:MAG: hypothetical protein ED556_01855 [Winogradskyella sp.]|uniref:hypothetical protein n=1 Tax=Winogradskyella sp. TaxID=1883156 RepID=UPI000F41B099|nr:hypothetical protein [Winogradskyella sp.]RNC87957.1 MAG: hypothetical protein ED556_01855 [Winogradskyella sp.]